MVAKEVFAILGYATCSSLMLIMNKVAVHVLPAPSFVLLMQFFASWFAVKLCGMCGCIVVDELEMKKLRQFFMVSVAFLACVFANIKTLQFANVETFVVFRASTPLMISLCDYWFLGRELPDRRSTVALLCLLLMAVGYVASDAHFIVKGYMWVGVWYAIFCFDQVYIKHAVDTVEVKSNWGRVFYTNLWASFISAIIMVATEPEVLPWTSGKKFDFTPVSLAALGASCVLGVSMSYFAFLARSSISATYFTVIGNVCKVLTVLINVFIWDKHATPTGLCFLFGSLVCAYFYKQAPLRTAATAMYAPVEQGQAEPGPR
eukprot:Transcript_14879.p2 GENE.Transcript_14879~~Transcript_14879.p2  ORF type:complete len:318 (-),score=164.82 Transcript_14879:1463-2416(-)